MESLSPLNAPDGQDIPLDEKLPKELYYDIVSQALVDELHDYLVTKRSLNFKGTLAALQLTSWFFNRLCRSYLTVLLGLSQEEPVSRIPLLLRPAEDIWNNIHNPTRIPTLEMEGYTAAFLEVNKSVLQVYYCLGLACWALKDEFLQWVVPAGEEYRALGYLLNTELGQGVIQKPEMDMYKPDYREEQEFHIFLPLACAVSLCDDIRAEELACLVSQLAADLIPPLCTMGILIKASHDLHDFIGGKDLMDENTAATYAQWTLGHLEQLPKLVTDVLQPVLEHGEVAKTNRVLKNLRRRLIPEQVIQLTDIMSNLRELASRKWPVHTDEINGRTRKLFEEWENLYCAGAQVQQVEVIPKKIPGETSNERNITTVPK